MPSTSPDHYRERFTIAISEERGAYRPHAAQAVARLVYSGGGDRLRAQTPLRDFIASATSNIEALSRAGKAVFK